MISTSRKTAGTIITGIGWFILGIALSIVALQRPLFEENQNTKFLHAAAETGYGFLSHDWVAHTIDPLPAFTMLIETLFRLHAIQLVYLLFPVMLAILLWGTSKNLLRGPIAALGGARNPHVHCVHSGFCAPSALYSGRS